MNIVYCFDEKYKELQEISANSFKKWNNDINIYCITEDKDNLLNEFVKEDLLGFKHVSKACFLRLLIPKLLPELDRALYVDCDTLCKGDISELYNTDFENNYILATRGYNYSDFQAKQLGLPYYIISGMMMFNIPLMNKEDYFKQIQENWRGALGKQKPFSADETIVNWVFHKKIKLVSEKWNYCLNRDYGDRKCDNPKILHVIGANKRKMYE